MIIDFHTHMFPDKIARGTLEFLEEACKTKPYTDGTCRGLLASADHADVDICVALPVVTKPSQFSSVNEFASGYQEGKIISFGGIHPETDDYKAQLRQIRDMGFKGIKLHPDYQDMYFNDIRYTRIVSYASELDLIVSVHAGIDPKSLDDVHCTPRMARELIEEVKPDKLVLAHLGGNRMWDEVERELVGLDVFFDTGVVLGCISQEKFLRIVDTHGADKILFATDSPWKGQKEYVKLLSSMPLKSQDKELIFSGNARRLLGI